MEIGAEGFAKDGRFIGNQMRRLKTLMGQRL